MHILAFIPGLFCFCCFLYVWKQNALCLSLVQCKHMHILGFIPVFVLLLSFCVKTKCLLPFLVLCVQVANTCTSWFSYQFLFCCFLFVWKQNPLCFSLVQCKHMQILAFIPWLFVAFFICRNKMPYAFYPRAMYLSCKPSHPGSMLTFLKREMNQRALSNKQWQRICFISLLRLFTKLQMVIVLLWFWKVLWWTKTAQTIHLKVFVWSNSHVKHTVVWTFDSRLVRIWTFGSL